MCRRRERSRAQSLVNVCHVFNHFALAWQYLFPLPSTSRHAWPRKTPEPGEVSTFPGLGPPCMRILSSPFLPHSCWPECKPIYLHYVMSTIKCVHGTNQNPMHSISHLIIGIKGINLPKLKHEFSVLLLTGCSLNWAVIFVEISCFFSFHALLPCCLAHHSY